MYGKMLLGHKNPTSSADTNISCSQEVHIISLNKPLQLLHKGANLQKLKPLRCVRGRPNK